MVSTLVGLGSSCTMALPSAYQCERQALESQIRLEKPRDVLQFCADYFTRRLAAERVYQQHQTLHKPTPNIMSAFTSPFAANSNPFGGDGKKNEASNGGLLNVVEEDENDNITSPTTPSFGFSGFSSGHFRGPFGGDGPTDGPPSSLRSPPNPDSYPPQYNFGRRTSVSAESLKPAADGNDNWSPPQIHKTQDQLDRLRKAIEGNFLFSHLDDEQNAQILGALAEKSIPAKDIKVITQGDSGDYFYVVEKGTFDVYISRNGAPGPDGLGELVSTIKSGGSFGELALMYNAPRAATVISAESGCTLWALDRVTFRRILMESTFARRRMYENFLEEVPLLISLTPYERSKIADALETQKFQPGHSIIRQGDVGTSFFLLEDGQCDAYLEQDGQQQLVKHYNKGDFFGELALLNDAPRAASIVSSTEVKVATLGKSAFARLLGPVEGIMRRTLYVKSGVEDVDPLQY
ncbi:putative cAMP-dependent protein kinase regulatory subunit [Seiridium unicorne]|uniref:cAMP-dependent protein kinase regulatory subunit n=1 Tax=Seiridium unicorne TaxID=138068 RepID=A0ABR2UL46_9PEZI